MKSNQLSAQVDIEAIGAPVSIVRVEPGDRFVGGAVNRHARDYYRVTSDWWIGRNLEEYEGLSEVLVQALKRSARNYRRCVRARFQLCTETRIDFADGNCKWARHTFVPIFTDQEVRQIMVTSIEITELKESQRQLEDAMTRMLSGLVTICSCCKNIRGDEQQWHSIEKFAAKRMGFHQFSHGLCPACFDKEMQVFGSDP